MKLWLVWLLGIAVNSFAAETPVELSPPVRFDRAIKATGREWLWGKEEGVEATSGSESQGENAGETKIEAKRFVAEAGPEVVDDQSDSTEQRSVSGARGTIAITFHGPLSNGTFKSSFRSAGGVCDRGYSCL